MRRLSGVFRALVLAFTLFLAVPANAQVTGATLSGTVTDTSGAVIPGVMIAIKNRATGVVRNVSSDEAGFYSAPNLLAGGYDVTASAAGFSTVTQSNITLTVGAQQQLNISMRVGETAQVIEVTSAAPLVQVIQTDPRYPPERPRLGVAGHPFPRRHRPQSGSPAALRERRAPREPRLWVTTEHLRGPAHTEQLQARRAQHQRLHERLGQRRRGHPGRGCDSGILRDHRQLLGRVWEDLRRGNQRHQQVGDQRIPWRRLQLPAQRQAGRERLLLKSRWAAETDLKAQPVRRRGRRSYSQGPDFHLRRLRGDTLCGGSRQPEFSRSV